jgi:hypothetical protein
VEAGAKLLSRLTMDQEKLLLSLLLREIELESTRNFDALQLAQFGLGHWPRDVAAYFEDWHWRREQEELHGMRDEHGRIIPANHAERKVRDENGHLIATANERKSSSSGGEADESVFSLMDIYTHLDADSDGFLSLPDLARCFSSYSVTPSPRELAYTMWRLDRDGDGKMMYMDVAEVMLPYAAVKPYSFDAVVTQSSSSGEDGTPAPAATPSRTINLDTPASFPYSSDASRTLPAELLQRLRHPPEHELTAEEKQERQEQLEERAIMEEQMRRTRELEEKVHSVKVQNVASGRGSFEDAVLSPVKAHSVEQGALLGVHTVVDHAGATDVDAGRRAVSFGGVVGPASPYATRQEIERHQAEQQQQQQHFSPQQHVSSQQNSTPQASSQQQMAGHSPQRSYPQQQQQRTPDPSYATVSITNFSQHQQQQHPQQSSQQVQLQQQNYNMASQQSQQQSHLYSPSPSQSYSSSQQQSVLHPQVFHRPVPTGFIGTDGVDMNQVLHDLTPGDLQGVLPTNYPFVLPRAPSAAERDSVSAILPSAITDERKTIAQVRMEQLVQHQAFSRQVAEQQMERERMQQYGGQDASKGGDHMQSSYNSTHYHRSPPPARVQINVLPAGSVQPSSPLSSITSPSYHIAAHAPVSPWHPAASPSSVSSIASPMYATPFSTGVPTVSGEQPLVRTFQGHNGIVELDVLQGDQGSIFGGTTRRPQISPPQSRASPPSSILHPRNPQISPPYPPLPPPPAGSARFAPSYPLRFPEETLARDVHQTLYFPIPLGVPSAMLPLTSNSIANPRLAGEISHAALVASLAHAQRVKQEEETRERERREEMRRSVQRIQASMASAVHLHATASMRAGPTVDAAKVTQVQRSIIPMQHQNTTPNYYLQGNWGITPPTPSTVQSTSSFIHPSIYSRPSTASSELNPAGQHFHEHSPVVDFEHQQQMHSLALESLHAHASILRSQDAARTREAAESRRHAEASRILQSEQELWDLQDRKMDLEDEKRRLQMEREHGVRMTPIVPTASAPAAVSAPVATKWSDRLAGNTSAAPRVTRSDSPPEDDGGGGEVKHQHGEDEALHRHRGTAPPNTRVYASEPSHRAQMTPLTARAFAKVTLSPKQAHRGAISPPADAPPPAMGTPGRVKLLGLQDLASPTPVMARARAFAPSPGGPTGAGLPKRGFSPARAREGAASPFQARNLSASFSPERPG